MMINAMFVDAKEALLGEAEERKQVIAGMVDVISDAIMVLKHRDGVNLTQDMARERAKNAVTVLISDYIIIRQE